MATIIQTWLNCALQQMAAESYLNQFLSSQRSLVEVLTNGNNNANIISPNQFTGATRFVNLSSVANASQITGSAQAFTASYQIIDHHANDSTGFSATLMQERGTNNFTLSFRSTEYQPRANGGDRARDGFGADAEISLGGGFAVGQLMAMENYYQTLKDSGLLPTGAVLNVTGYSLGGHFATVFTELHTAEINHTYTFNGAGRGHITGGLSTETTEADRIAGMLALFKRVLFNPDDGLAVLNDPDNVAYNAAKQIEGQPFTPFASETTIGDAGNIYSNARYQWAAQAVAVRYQTTSVSLPPGEVGEGPAFSPDKFTQLFGHAAQDDSEYVANSGVHGPQQAIYIEDQPNLDGFGGFFGDNGDYGTTHSITLIVDSLATQELFQTVAPTLTQSDMEAIFAASSNQVASGFAGTSGVAEGNSLENALDALGKLFVPNYTQTPSGRQTGDFGSLTFRNPFYGNLAAVKTALAGATVTIEPFVEMGVVDGQPKALPSLTPDQVVTEAQQETDRGLAFRYALKSLNPFAVIGADYNGLGHASNGALTLFDPATSFGEMTPQYLVDRAAFLEAKIELGLLNQDKSTDMIHFRDVASNYEIKTTALFEIDNRQFVFGGEKSEVLQGEGLDDHLYGGKGHDVLIGQGGADYLEGNAGHDILAGGAGNDELRGGAGFDTYVYNTGDGTDRIEDAEGTNAILFDQQLLQGGIRQAGAGAYTSLDGRFTYVQFGGDLIVNGVLTLNDNFQNGEFGIRLLDLPVFGEATRTVFEKIDHYVQVGNNPDGTPILDPVYTPFFDDQANDTRNTTPLGGLVPAMGDENNLIHALGGDDYILSGAGDDQLYGDGGNDEIYGGLGNDRLLGGGEDDLLFGDDETNSTSGGNDYLDGADGNDFVQGGAGRDILLGGAGNDVLSGDETAGSDPGASDNSGAFDDWLDGGSGDDILHGGAGSDVLIGGADNDLLVGDTTQYQNGRPELGGNDELDGGSGDDELDGLYGDDVLNGGSGKDLVNGQDGSDVLYGGDDNDILSGDLRIKSLSGSLYVYDTNEYRAAGGDDLLFGEDGNDIMFGGEGSDTLQGDIGDDSLFGAYNTGLVSSSDPLYWTLFTALGNDWLDAGAGNDVVHGGVGSDTLLGEEGNDLLYGSGGDDVLEGGTGDDALYGDYFLGEFVGNPFLSQITALAGNNRLGGGAGNDDLYGGDRADTLLGGDGNDRLFGGSGIDVLIGGNGDDRIIDDDPNTPVVGENETLDGGGGNDYLESWWGDDMLLGGTGNDTLVSRAGNDALTGDEGDDRLIWDNTTSTAPQILYGGSGDDVYEIATAGADAMEFAGEGTDLVITSAVESYTLPDNIENLTTGGAGIGNDLDNVIRGGIGTLEGRAGNDTLIGPGRLDGGAGGDVLEGGSRIYIYAAPPPPQPGDFSFGGLEPLPSPVPTVVTNTYVFGVDYGHDTIQEMDPEFNSAYNQNLDTVEFLSGIAPSDVTWQRNGNNLELSVNGGPDRLTIQSFYDLSFNVGGYNVNGLWVPPQGFETTMFSRFPSYYAHSRVESFTFDDGTVWTADHFGAPLLGDFRADTYRFGRGSGDVTVLDFDFVSPSSPDKQIDVLRVGPRLSPVDLSVSVVNGVDLMLSIDSTGDRFTMQSFFTSVVVFPPFSNGYTTLPYQIEQVQFDDGTTWSFGDLINRISTISGTATTDSLYGNSLDNLIQGLDGNDTLSGGGGNDVLAGGLGADLVAGGAGDDTYVFNIGDGIDTIEDAVAAGEGNRIQFGDGITSRDLVYTEDQAARTLLIQVGNGDDVIRLTHFDPTGMNGSLVVGSLALADGGTVNLAELFPPIVNHVPTLATPLVDQTVPEDSPFNLVIPRNTFTDEDAGDVLTFSASLADGTDLPAWLTFDAATATFSGTPDDAQVGALDLKVTATDQDNLNVSDVFTFTVNNVNEAPTVAAPLANQTALEDTAFSFAVPGSTFADEDQVHGDQLTYRATIADGAELLTWLSFDAVTHTFSGTPGNDDVGMLAITVTVTDQSNLSASTGFTLAIQNVNDAPTVVNPLADLTAAEDSAFTLTFPDTTFTDEDLIHGDILTYSATLADGSPLPSWLNFDTTSRTFSGTSGAGDAGSLQIAVTATDAEALSATDLFTLTVSGPLPQTIIGTEGDDVLTGGRGDDTLTGLAGNDLLDGGIGLDTMIGGSGNDVYVVDSSSDVVVELANEGFDTEFSAATVTLSPNVELLVLTGTNGINGTGNSLNNGLAGNNAANVLDGGAGADVMAGLDGDDTYIVDNSSDVVVELTNQGNDTVRSSVTYSLASNIENLTLTGSAAINGTGNGLDNVLTGNSAANTLTGGAGNDTYVVGAGDTVVESSDGGTDTVQSSVAWTLASNCENLTLVGTTAINGTGNSLNNVLLGNSAANVLSGAGGNDTLRGGFGNDTVNGGSGDDRYLFGRGEGQDLVQDSGGPADKILYDAGINPLDLVISRQANDLRLSLHGSTDTVTIQHWYNGTKNQVETIQAGSGETFLSTQVDQLIQAMASFSQQTGLTWDQAIDQRPQDVQTVLAASWH